MELSACDQVGLYLFERDAFFMLPRPGNQHVLDVLPQCPVFLEVDYGRRLAAFRVSDELNSGHGRVSLCGVEPVLTLIAMPRPVNRLARHTWQSHSFGPHPFFAGAAGTSTPASFSPSRMARRDRKSTRLNSSHLGISY